MEQSQVVSSSKLLIISNCTAPQWQLPAYVLFARLMIVYVLTIAKVFIIAQPNNSDIKVESDPTSCLSRLSKLAITIIGIV